jgi:hypothetical protein
MDFPLGLLRKFQKTVDQQIGAFFTIQQAR